MLSEILDNRYGVLQYRMCSAKLFTDFSESLDQCDDIDLFDILLMYLLFVDGFIIFDATPTALQKQFPCLHQYPSHRHVKLCSLFITVKNKCR